MPEEGRWLGIGLALAVLALAARRLPWFKVRGDTEAQRVFGMFVCVVILLRVINTHVLAGVNLHFLGAAVAYLMFGAPFALFAMAVVSLVHLGFGNAWQGWGWDFLATGALPIAVAWAWSRLLWARLPYNLFIYTIGNAFLGGGLSMLVVMLTKAAIVALLGGEATPFLIAAIPMGFGEAFFTGGAMALIVVYRPQWCATFDDAKYLAPPD